MKSVKIKNFNCQLFEKLIQQSLIVSSTLMLEVKNNILSSANKSASLSFAKLWQIPIEDLILVEKQKDSVEKPNVINLDEILIFNEDTKIDKTLFIDDYQNFVFYIIKGEMLLKYLSLYSNASPISIEFTFSDENINSIPTANTIIFTGKSISGTLLKTELLLSDEQNLNYKIEDFTSDNLMFKPKLSDFVLTLNSKQYKEIKQFISKLKGTRIDNTAYLTFQITDDVLKIFDKTFEIDYPHISLYNGENKKYSGPQISFNLYKEEFDYFNLENDSNLNIFHNPETQKIVYLTNYGNCIIYSLSNKIMDLINTNVDLTENALSHLDLSQYNLEF